MQVSDFRKILDETGFAVGYYQFPKGKVPKLPYILFYFPTSDDVYADNKNYVNIQATNVELYTKNKNFSAEKSVEDVLKSHNIKYQKTETYLTTEDMFLILYEMEIITD